MKNNRDPWKGSTSVLILATLAEAPRHGYAIAREIARQSNALISLGEGSLYPALLALEQEGLVVSEWQPPTAGGPARKVYTLTDEGRGELTKRAKDVHALAQTIADMLKGAADATPFSRA